MKKLCCTLFLVCMVLCTANAATAETTIDSTYKQNQASYTNYKDCIKLYKLPFGKLFMLALSSVNSANYEILEMQSRNGYIIFKAEGREFLLDVLAKNKSYSYLKITPCDNNYYFNPKIPVKIFNGVTLHFNDEIKEIKI